MGSLLNFKNIVDPTLGSNNLPLTRQNSVFSLTFDELQNSLYGGIGKEFGSMNMDELLKNIWTVEETQSIISNNNTSNHNNNGCLPVGGGLQRQGSLTLPRTLSQKKVDDVWKELMNEDDTGGDGGEKQQSLGEMTLEEFLSKVGVVKEESQPMEKLENFNDGFYGFGSNVGLGSGRNGLGLDQLQPLQMQQQVQLMQKEERSFPKQTTIAFSDAIDVDNRSHSSTQCQEVKPSIHGIKNNPLNNNLLQAVDLSPRSQMSPDLAPKNAIDASLSPVPYVFGRVRKTGAVLEKVIERRQKRMIKNRESAARSRARKQAYTLELEAEIVQLKELNEELQKKQVDFKDKEKKQIVEPLDQPLVCKRQCLRRTSTGPW